MENFVSIEDIENAKDGILEYTFEDSIEGINSDGPVRADLTIKNLGEFVEVTGNVKGILNYVWMNSNMIWISGLTKFLLKRHC